MEDANTQQACKCPHHKIVPILIVFIGVIFLLKGFGVLNSEKADIIWPIGIVLIGLNKIMGSACRCCK